MSGGKVVSSGEINGFVYLEKDWDGSSLPEDLVEEAGILGTDFSLLAPTKRAVLGGYFRSGEKAVFKIERDQYPMILNEASEVLIASDLNRWDPFSDPEKWRMQKKDKLWELRLNWDELIDSSPFGFKFVTGEGVWLDPPVESPSLQQSRVGSLNYEFNLSRTGKDILIFKIIRKEKCDDLNAWINYRPCGKFGFFEDEKRSKVFRVFAPRAKQVDLLIYQTVEKIKPKRLPLFFQTDGSWTIELDKSFESSFYMLSVSQEMQTPGKNRSFEKIILDPYARATMGREGPGLMIPEPPKVKKTERHHPPAIRDLVIVESHVRDLLQNVVEDPNSSNISWFEELTNWLSGDDCYLKKLGANALELQPVLEFDSRSRQEYHWGYMPVNFFSPESTFANDLEQGGSISQFKELIDVLHANGFSVILDVVYNHVGIPGHLLKLDRELYFRMDDLGRLQNFSGCGNDLNCESEPVRKLILDSLTYLVEVFDVDGFRFDLGELLGLELLAEIESRLKTIKPSIALIAEPWSFRGRLPDEIQKTGYSLWSDACRESILKFVKDGVGSDQILKLLSGKLDSSSKPWQSINYVESHDDFSFVDRICGKKDREAEKFPSHLIDQVKLALFLVLFSPGVPMISAGQDFMRHKKGVRNTYKRGDLNALNYEDLEKYDALSSEIQRMIAFRLSERGKFLRPKEECDLNYCDWKDAPDGILGIKAIEKERETLIVINFSSREVVNTLPKGWENTTCLLSGFKAKSSLPPYSYQVLGR